MIVVMGYSDEEQEEQIAVMRARGEVTDADLIVCIMKFGDHEPDEAFNAR